MITSDGWLDWVERVPGHPSKVNGGVNPAIGFVGHSAEGWEVSLRALVADPNRRASWHFSNLLDGRLLQHYPITARCWHAGSGYPNNNFVSMEHEGMAGTPITDAQAATTARALLELILAKGWSYRRPSSGSDVGATVYEHRECTRWGSDPTACPSDRIRWSDIEALLLSPQQGDPDMMIPRNGIAQWFEDPANQNIGNAIREMQVASDLGLPTDARMARLDVYMNGGGVTFFHGHDTAIIAGIAEPQETHVIIDVVLSPTGTCWFAGFGAESTVRRIGLLGYWT